MDCAYMNPSAGCSGQPQTCLNSWAEQPVQTQPVFWNQQAPQWPMPDYYCPDTSPKGMEQYPVGMGYVPWQQWQQTYSLEQGLNRGTIFPDLDLPFVMGRCRKS